MGINTQPPTTGRAMLAEVRANMARLKSCRQHSFSVRADDKLFGGKWTCAACGGTVDGIARGWYQLGLDHAGAVKGQ